MAATRPRAVANNASAMPGATTARLVFLVAAMEAKLFMMPHTVPNSPTNGAEEPTEARNPICRSSCSISRPSVMSMTRSIRSLRPALSSVVVSRPLAAERRHSRMAATKMDDSGSGGLLPRRSNSSSSDPPDQKLSSNCLALKPRPRMRIIFEKMMAQLQNEARISARITTLTTMSACQNRPMRLKSYAPSVPGSGMASRGTVGTAVTGSVGTACTVPVSFCASWRRSIAMSRSMPSLLRNPNGNVLQRRLNSVRQPCRAPGLVQTGELHLEPHQIFAVALHGLHRLKRGAPYMDDPRLHLQQIVEPRRLQIVRLAAAHEETEARVAQHARMIGAGVAHEFGARPLGEAQIVGVIHDAPGIGVFVVDADGKGVRVGMGLSACGRGALGDHAIHRARPPPHRPTAPVAPPRAW